MLPIAGQTAEPIGLIFFCGHPGVAGGCYRLKNRDFFLQFIFCPRATPGPPASDR